MRTINEIQFEEICYDGMYALDYKSAMRKFYEVAVDAVPVVRGEWVKKSSEEAEILALCSKCSYPISWWHKTNYCPNCGAKMESEGGT